MNPDLIDSLGWAMAQVYASVTDRLLINLARHFKLIKEGETVPKSWEYQVQKLAEMGQVTRESAAIIAQSLDGADAALKTMLETAIRDGLKTTEPQLRKAAEKGLLLGQGFLPPELAPNQMQAFQAYYRQSADKLNLVNTVMLESTQAAYTGTISDIVTRINNTQQILNTASGEVITGVSSVNQAIRGGVRKMVDNGLTGFIDHGGHHWSPEAYVAMDTRTTVANTARAAVFERMESYADDLYVVSYHNGARPLCYPWQLKVISRSDWTGEVEDLDGNKIHVYAQSETSYGEPAGLFGINCKHYPSPFIPGVSTIHGEPQDEEANEKAYAESQEQRRLERKLRQEKRDLEVLKAQDATDDEIAEQKRIVRNASNDLMNFCNETGRPRRRERETAPINASFQDGYQQSRFGGRKPLNTAANQDIINLPDIPITKGAGARGRNFYVLDLGTGEEYTLVAGTSLKNVQVFAGKGTSFEYRNADKYAEKYGNNPEDWQHVKGNGILETEDGDRPAEIHWSQSEQTGAVDHFVKRWLDE